MLNRKQRNKIQADEVKYLKRVRGVIKMGRIRHLEIRKDLRNAISVRKYRTRKVRAVERFIENERYKIDKKDM